MNCFVSLADNEQGTDTVVCTLSCLFLYICLLFLIYVCVSFCFFFFFVLSAFIVFIFNYLFHRYGIISLCLCSSCFMCLWRLFFLCGDCSFGALLIPHRGGSTKATSNTFSRLSEIRGLMQKADVRLAKAVESAHVSPLPFELCPLDLPNNARFQTLQPYETL